MSLIQGLKNAAVDVAAVKAGGKFACPSSHPMVTDEKDHFPLDTIGRARNALARVVQYGSKKPKWWSGSLAQLKALIKRKVRSLYPSIDVSD